MISKQALHRTQRGAVLIVSMILLAIMTILALAMSKTTTLQERMAGNARDLSVATEAAESGLRGGEDLIKKSSGTPTLCASLGACVVSGGVLAENAIDSAGIDVAQQTDAWWAANATAYGTGGKDLSDVVADPHYIVEEAGKDTESLHGMTIGKGSKGPPRQFYRIYSRAHGRTEVTEVVAESVYTL